MERFVTDPGDTPLRQVPADYEAGGSGRWFVLRDGPDAGKRMFVLEKLLSDGDTNGPTVLFVHGNPECSYTYRKVIAALGQRSLPTGTRVIAMDHIGFGRSDQATYEMVDMHHARNLEQLVEALDLRDVTLVIHDWGGPIGIGALLQSPERVANLVVLNSTVFPMPPDGRTYTNFPIPVLLPWARSAKTVPDRLWGYLAAFVATATAASPVQMLGAFVRFIRLLMRKREPAWEVAAVFRDQFAPKANARSSKRMVRQTPVWGHGYRYIDPQLGPQDNHAFYADIQERLGPTWGPGGQAIGAAMLCGAWDPLAKASVLDQWRAALPQLEDVQVFDDESHFIEEHRPDEIADAIARLLEG
jgi:pimeloyl-ACP methyl ester carboxylesterase